MSRRATVLCEVEVNIDLYDEDEYDSETDERRHVWQEAKASLGAAELLALKSYTVQ